MCFIIMIVIVAIFRGRERPRLCLGVSIQESKHHLWPLNYAQTRSQRELTGMLSRLLRKG